MLAVSRVVDRLVAVVVLQRLVGSSAQERLANLKLPFPRREHQGRPAFVRVGGIDVGPFLQKQRHRLWERSARGEHQGRAAVDIRQVRVGAML